MENNWLNKELPLDAEPNKQHLMKDYPLIEMKYFTPSIEDIRIGYEAEVNWGYYRNPDGTKSSNPDGWKPVVFKGVDEAVRKYHSLGMYRVPYLTKEQIEVEGWEQRGNEKYFYKKGLTLFYEFDKHLLTILRVTKSSHDCNIKPDIDYTNLFKGECKDINTFRYIIKLLGI